MCACRPSAFGSTCNVSGRFVKDILENTKIVSNVVEWASARQKADLAKIANVKGESERKERGIGNSGYSPHLNQ